MLIVIAYSYLHLHTSAHQSSSLCLSLVSLAAVMFCDAMSRKNVVFLVD